MQEQLLSYDTALARTLAQRFDWGAGVVALGSAQGRVLAEPACADRPLPPFDRVTLDGIALRYADYAAGRRRFRSEGVRAAGAPPVALSPAPGACYEVMTGAVLPQGATTVVKVESLRRVGADYEVPAGLTDGTGIHARGSDAAAGERLLPAGHVVRAASLGVLAGIGAAEVSVRRLPRTAVVSTGDELVPVGDQPGPAQIRRSNDRVLDGLLRTAGLRPTCIHLTDDRAGLKAKLGDLLADYDLIILSGGVSRGRFDFVPEVLASLGVERLLHGVAQRPGKPLWVGRTTRTMVFGLPGNPVSTLACAVAYVGPWLRANLGVGERPPSWARVERPWPFALALRLLRPVVHVAEREGRRIVESVGGGSGDYVGAARADGFLALPAGEAGFEPGHDYVYLRHDTLLG